MSKVDLSIVAPFYNESENLPLLYDQISEVVIKINKNVEIVFVDDGSHDDSVDVIKHHIKAHPKKNLSSKLIILSKNSGQTAATSAGLDNSEGELISFIDTDLQNDPQDLIVMLEKIEEGSDAVFGWRKNRKDDNGRTLVSKIANFIVKKVFNVPVHDLGCSLKVFRRELLSDFRLYGEIHRLLSVVIYWNSTNSTEVIVNHRGRVHGKSKYGYSRIMKLIVDLITIKFLTSYGTKPAYVFGGFGLVCNLAGILSLFYVIFRKVFDGVYVHRNPAFLLAIFFIVIGFQFILMGLLAELIIRTYYESGHKKTYTIKSTLNF